MGKVAKNILKKFRKERKVTFDDVKELYRDQMVKEVDFVTDGNDLVITRIMLKNGESLPFN